MKKLISIILSIVLVAALVCSPSGYAKAASTVVYETVEIIPEVDGYYVVRLQKTLNSRSTIGGQKEISYYSQSGLAWTFRVFGDFYYNGTISYATNAYSNYTIHESGWSNSSASALLINKPVKQ